MENIEQHLESVYPTPVLRGTCISRMDERRLGRLHFDSTTAKSLGENNVGVFAGECKNLERVLSWLHALDSCGSGGNWVVVSSTRKMAAVVQQKWLGQVPFVDPRTVPDHWQTDRLMFAVPETLHVVGEEVAAAGVNVAGIIVLDMFCEIHKARGFENRGFRVQHDRPELIVNFRSSLSRGCWSPPLIFCAQKPAKAVGTNSMLSPYCLETFRYIDGTCIRAGQPPAELSEPLPSYYGERASVCVS